MTFVQSASRLSATCALLLGWRPSEFWGATPVELHAIFEGIAQAHRGDAPPDHADMVKLMEMFPDG